MVESNKLQFNEVEIYFVYGFVDNMSLITKPAEIAKEETWIPNYSMNSGRVEYKSYSLGDFKDVGLVRGSDEQVFIMGDIVVSMTRNKKGGPGAVIIKLSIKANLITLGNVFDVLNLLPRSNNDKRGKLTKFDVANAESNNNSLKNLISKAPTSSKCKISDESWNKYSDVFRLFVSICTKFNKGWNDFSGSDSCLYQPDGHRTDPQIPAIFLAGFMNSTDYGKYFLRQPRKDDSEALKEERILVR